MTNFRFKPDEQTLEQQIIRSLKLDYVTEPLFPDNRRRVLTRSNNVYRSERRGERWRENVERRLGQLKDGYFGEQTEAFRSIGIVITDPKELTYKTVRPRVIFRKETTSPCEGNVRNKTSSCRRVKKQSTKKPNRGDILKSKSGRDLTSEQLQINCRRHEGGLSLIRSQLLHTRRRLTAVKCGWPYEKYISEFETVSSAQSESRKSPVMRKLSAFMEPDGRGSQAISDDVFSFTSCTLFQKDDRLLNNLRQKFRYVYLLLTSIHNMRIKDLRTRKPLQKDVVVSLRYGKHFGRDAHGCMVGSSRRSRTSRVLGSTVISGSSSSRYKHQQNLLKSSSKMPRTPRRIIERESSSVGIIETWDDLLTAGNISTNKPLRRQNFTGLPNERKREKRLPIWQTVSQQIKAITANKVIDAPLTPVEQAKEERANFIVNNRKTMMLGVHQQNKITAETVKKIEAEKLLTFYRKYAAFDELPPCYIMQREKMDRISSQYYSDLLAGDNDTESQAQPWYVVMCKYAKKNFPKDKDFQKMTFDMARYSSENLNENPHMKEYLCLLSQSFPVLEMCTEPVQQAFRFVIREVLGSHEELVDQWLKHRRLPILNFSDI